jgi:polyisoprenyl-phosphate glycosyltransferase
MTAPSADGRSSLWVVCPLLRDTESFVRLRTEVASHCAAAGCATPERYVVVDDSAGVDAEVIELSGLPDVTVLTTPFNLGHQRAIVFGLRYVAPEVGARDVVVTMDSDGQDQPADVPRLVGALTDSRTALALALRTKRSEPLAFRLMYVCFRVLFRVLTGTTVRSGNFAAQRGDSLLATIDHPSFDLCYSSSLLALRRPTTTVPCARGDRFAGESRMSRFSLVAHGVRMLLPFSEAIAVRMLVIAGASLIALATFLALVAVGSFGDPATAAVLAGSIGLAVVFLASFCAFVVLFSGFSQASAIAMKGIVVPTPARRAGLTVAEDVAFPGSG